MLSLKLLDNADKTKNELIEKINSKIEQLEILQKKDKRDKMINMLTSLNIMAELQSVRNEDAGIDIFFITHILVLIGYDSYVISRNKGNMERFKKEERSYLRQMEDRLFSIVGILGEKMNDMSSKISSLIPTAYYIE